MTLSPARIIGQQRIPSLFDTLSSTANVRLRLTYAFDSLYRTNREEISAVVSIGSEENWLLLHKDIKLTLRGKFRRIKCAAMPPLLLNFRKSDLRDIGLADIDEMKLVTHCLQGPEGLENLQEERLCYQAYAATTRFAYRTIWVEVTYCDQGRDNSCITTSGFLLEPDEDLHRRLDIRERKIFNVDQDSLDFESYSRVTAFNFLIGNRDWSIVANRNAKLFYQAGAGKYVVIPYDFDFSNVVGASYRRETMADQIAHPFDRVYQGEYFAPEAPRILKQFTSQETAILEAVRTAPNDLEERRRERIAGYLSAGFRFIRKAIPETLTYGVVCPYRGHL